jgi:uncharacterized membrane protein
MAPVPLQRVYIVDAIRGAALVAMSGYHFVWDLGFYELISIDIGDSPSWAVFARLIAGSFLVIVGVSLVLAHGHRFRLKLFLKRFAIVATAAALVTLVTWWFMPEDFIYFGILHCIALSSVLALPFLRLPLILVLAAVAFCFAAPSLFADPTFDAPSLRWIGLMTYFPETNDYVPLLPWMGAVLGGIAAARTIPFASGHRWTDWKATSPGTRILVWSGQHTLAVYLLHQPVFLGVLYLVALAVGR